MTKESLPSADYEGLQIVQSVPAFLKARFNKASKNNAVLHPRDLQGDYDGLAIKLAPSNLTPHERIYVDLHEVASNLNKYALTKNEKVAFEQLQEDAYALQTTTTYLYIEHPLFGLHARNDTWHHDTAPRMDSLPNGANFLERILITYNTKATECLKNQDAIHKFNDEYQAKEGAEIWAPSCGDLFKIAPFQSDWGNQAAVHRRPQITGNTPRLIRKN